MGKSLTRRVLAAAVLAGWLSYPQSASRPTQADVVQQRHVAAPPTSFIIHQQECARQGREEFHRDGWDSVPHTQVFEHYNERLKRCFVEINFSGFDGQGRLLINKSLSDTRGRDYADYVSIMKSGDKPSRTPPLFCEIVLSSGEPMECGSAAEFNAIVADYMK